MMKLKALPCVGGHARAAFLAAALALTVGWQTSVIHAAPPPLRPPSVPLVACDPYFSVWSPADKLTDKDTVHWTGKPHPLHCLVRVDGKPFRLLGTAPQQVPALPQTSTQVLPTRTICRFEGAGVRVVMTFTTPALPDDLMIYSRPVTYVSWQAESSDGQPHAVQVYFDGSALLAVNTPDQPLAWETSTQDNLRVLKAGTVEQPVLRKRGDDLRIDWGYFYVAAPEKTASASAVVAGEAARAQFAANGALSPALSVDPAAGARPGDTVLATVLDLGRVGGLPSTAWLVLAYDDLYSIQYFKQNLRPYWRRNGDGAAELLKKSAAEYESLARRCAEFDERLMLSLVRDNLAGEQYALICALAYRQCHAANKLAADSQGQPLLFPKENFSNGCIATVDVIYPMAPQFLLFSRSLTKAMLVPIMDYASSPRWRFPFAPHDLGTYPLANGQVYGGGERTEENQMPVEETGNMLILLAALAQAEGNADFCDRYWPLIERWADYLQAKGFDPENQLCTDDFAGHLAHNVNLSAKAICGLGSFARLCELRGDQAKARQYKDLAREFAGRWAREADDGEKFRLAFDRPGTWSQKYNLVWDRILGLGLFPASIARKEMDFYKKVQNRYGLPLDNRKDYTKLDWTLWTATLTRDRKDFEALVAPVFRFLNETPDRLPMTDWYDTKTAKHVGFQARSVIGGVFLEMLYVGPEWKRWVGQGCSQAKGWAALPVAPTVVQVVPTSESGGQTWLYTTARPGDDWPQPGFDVSQWKQAAGGFGTQGTPGAVVRTPWNSSEIWLRREFELSADKLKNLALRVHHDEDAVIYVNGVRIAQMTGYTTEYDDVPLSPAAMKAFKPGKNVLAVHCRQTAGGQYIDAGFSEVKSGP